jgi:hypothetical protein
MTLISRFRVFRMLGLKPDMIFSRRDGHGDVRRGEGGCWADNALKL